VSRVLLYMAGAVFIWWGIERLPITGVLSYAVRAVGLLVFVALVWKAERPTLRPLTT
jgi:hypothetical protein